MASDGVHRFLRAAYVVLAAAALLASLVGAAYLRRIHRYDELIGEAARRHGVDARLVSCLIWRESRFDPSCVGSHGEIGLMQITSEAVRDWAKANGRPAPTRDRLFDPKVNIEAGTWYLARALKFWQGRDDPVPFALAEYNAGRTNAQRWATEGGDARRFLAAIGYPTTRRYVHDILERYR